jgi:hypothetical protein
MVADVILDDLLKVARAISDSRDEVLVMVRKVIVWGSKWLRFL